MDNDPSLSWSDHLNGDHLMPVPGQEDDFSNFFEFGMDFSSAATTTNNNPNVDAVSAAVNHAAAQKPMAHHHHQRHHQYCDPQRQQHQRQQHGHDQHQSQPHPQSQQQQQQQPVNLPRSYVYGVPMIPPTPNSVEFHGGAAQFAQNGEDKGDMNERYMHMSDDRVLSFIFLRPCCFHKR